MAYLIYKQQLLFPAREVNAQQKNGGRLVCAAKRQNGGGKSKRALGVPCQLEWGRFCGEGTFTSGRLENRFESRFGKNTKLLSGVFGLYLSQMIIRI